MFLWPNPNLKHFPTIPPLELGETGDMGLNEVPSSLDLVEVTP